MAQDYRAWTPERLLLLGALRQTATQPDGIRRREGGNHRIGRGLHAFWQHQGIEGDGQAAERQSAPEPDPGFAFRPKLLPCQVQRNVMNSPLAVARRARHWIVAIGAFGLLTFTATAQAPLDFRLALVIGNSAYADAPLLNPANDARSVGEALRKLGFSVEVVLDANKAQMTGAIDALGARLKSRKGIAIVYYAGHGLQVDHDNYVVPVDARIRNEADLAAQSVNLSQLLTGLTAAGNRLNIVVLDACRDNPFKTRKDFAGLAPRDAPKGVLLAYATEPGNVARDGDAASGNGLYTQFLLKELARPMATIDEVFKRVRFAVRRASDGQQVPAYTNGLEDDIGLENGFVNRPADPKARAERFGLEKAQWDRIRTSKNPEDHFAFIDAYPNSGISELAQALLERLARRKILSQAEKGEAQQNPGDSRFRLGDAYSMRFIIDGGPTSSFTARVTDVTEDHVRVSDVFGPGQPGQYSIAGAVIQDGVSTYDPPYVLIPGGEYQVGKRWAGRSLRTYKAGYNGGKTEWMDYSARVVARERVVVPAGTFDTYRIEYDFQLESGRLLQSVMWAQPEWGLAVKLRFQFQDGQTAAIRTGTRELMDRKRGS